MAKQTSQTERRAEEAERETVKLKKAEYMSQHIGQVFDGVVSSITKWGMYVELPNTVEGLVHVTAMSDDHYEYYEDRYEMVGSHTGRVYKLGQEIRVKVTGADCLQRTIDFEIVKEGEPEDGETESSPSASAEEEKETSVDGAVPGETEPDAEEEKNPDENNTDNTGSDAGQAPEKDPDSELTIGAANGENSPASPEDDASAHWLQQYQQAAMGAADMTMQRSRSARASSASPSGPSRSALPRR